MNVKDSLFSRYSCRLFRSDPVDRELVLKILEASIRSPSWANTQPWEIFVAGGKKLENLRHTYLQNFNQGTPGNPDIPAPTTWPEALQNRIDELLKPLTNSQNGKREEIEIRKQFVELNYKLFNAPVIIFLCMDRTLSSWSMFDLGAMSLGIMLMAQENGLGTIPAFMLAKYPEAIRAELEIPRELSVVIGIALGFPDSTHHLNQIRTPRRYLEEVITLRGF